MLPKMVLNHHGVQMAEAIEKGKRSLGSATVQGISSSVVIPFGFSKKWSNLSLCRTCFPKDLLDTSTESIGVEGVPRHLQLSQLFGHPPSKLLGLWFWKGLVTAASRKTFWQDPCAHFLGSAIRAQLCQGMYILTVTTRLHSTVCNLYISLCSDPKGKGKGGEHLGSADILAHLRGQSCNGIRLHLGFPAHQTVLVPDALCIYWAIQPTMANSGNTKQLGYPAHNGQ